MQNISVSWYINQIQTHRKRVYQKSVIIFGKNHTVTKMMKWHDLEKLILLPVMVYTWKYNPKWSRTFYDFLNHIGNMIHWIRFGDSEWIRWCHEWEHVIDITDRSCDSMYFYEFKKEKKDIGNFLNQQQFEMHRIILHNWN